MQANIILFFEDDSVSWDLTTFIIAKALKKEKNDDIIKVECFDEMDDPWMRQSDGTSSMFQTKVMFPLAQIN